MKVERRDFLLLRTDGRTSVLSCERLYMRFVDSRIDGTTAELFANLAHDLAGVRAIRLVDRSWLSDDDLKRQLREVLDSFRDNGGRIDA